jgi:glycosyltransferase involved in cell wall biosynthesis
MVVASFPLIMRRLDMRTTVDIVVPCFNEAENLPLLFEKYLEFRKSQESRYIINLLIVDNGSSDDTTRVARDFIELQTQCKLVVLSRNFGKEASLSAGLNESRADLVVPIDADLQDPIEVIEKLLENWEQTKADVILAKRSSTLASSKSRRFFSVLYSRIFSKLTDIQVDPGIGEFRLMTRKVVDAFTALPESQRFVRGLFAWMGFKTQTVEFERQTRKIGKSRFSYARLMNLAIDGIVSFSTKPLRLSVGIGLLTSFSAFVLSLVLLIEKIINNISVPGYTSMVVIILFLGGVQLFSIGVLGEYVGKILLETKRRPLYIVSERAESGEKQGE